jgi:hypothetical protein
VVLVLVVVPMIVKKRLAHVSAVPPMWMRLRKRKRMLEMRIL